MKIVVAGGTGFVGHSLVQNLAPVHDLVVLTRNPPQIPPGKSDHLCYVRWDAATLDDWQSHICGCDAVINLVGESVASGRWTQRKKDRILSSRVDATRVLVQSIREASVKPSVLINASAVGYYGNVPEGLVTEDYRKGDGFLAEVCEQWEKEALQAEKLGVRVVLLRFGIVLGKDGGALSKMSVPFRFGLGGPIGSGRQGVPWIHYRDAIDIIRFVLEQREISGPVNGTAPDPANMERFCAVLGHVLQRPSWLRVPTLLLKLVLGEMSLMFLNGQAAVPAKLTQHGYSFQYPLLENALKDIFK